MYIPIGPPAFFSRRSKISTIRVRYLILRLCVSVVHKSKNNCRDVQTSRILFVKSGINTYCLSPDKRYCICPGIPFFRSLFRHYLPGFLLERICLSVFVLSNFPFRNLLLRFAIGAVYPILSCGRGGRANGCGFFPLPLLFREGPGAKYLPLSYR